ncbi:MAG TPA: hypothetical protein VEF76_08070, partial [Patescibacteria group bacterium]|nr:hypothetical protein [Patescibacteria group bacterium]
QHIKKISSELAKIDEKIDAMKTGRQPVDDYAPALSAMRTTIADFEASAKKLPPDAREGLDRLKVQVAALEKKISNDDSAPPSAKPAAS